VKCYTAWVCQGPSKITPIGKRGCCLRLDELPNILGFPYNISAAAEASNFKINMQLGFAKAHHKTTLRGKVGVVLG